MAGGWSLPPVSGVGVTYGVSTATSGGTTLTSSATINGKGSWVQLTASTTADINRLMLVFDLRTNSAGQTAVDISTGGVGSEASGLIIQNLVVSGGGDLGSVMELPVHIPAGRPITARCSCNTASDTMQISAIGFSTGYTESLNAGLYDSYGYAGTGAVQGNSVDPGATANTKGVWTVLTASTTNDLAGFILGFDLLNGGWSVDLNCSNLYDVAVGASGSESIIVPNFPVSKITGSGFAAFGPHYSPIIWIPVKAGTRMSMRAQCAVTNTGTYRQMGCCIYGVRA